MRTRGRVPILSVMAVVLFVYGLALASLAVLAVWGAFVLEPEDEL